MDQEKELALLKRRLQQNIKELQRTVEAANKFTHRTKVPVTKHVVMWELFTSQLSLAGKAFDA